MDYRGKWALVTGASAGIGQEFVRQLAESGANVVMVARREDRLKELSALLDSHGTKTIPLAADLSDPDAPESIVAFLEEQGINIDILINNAGFGLPGKYISTSWAEQEKYLQLMVSAYAELTHRLLERMQARGYGRVINVASVAGLVPPAAGHTLYGPSKSFLVSFSQALAAEYNDTDINVSALCPGFTYTEFHDVNNTREQLNKMPDFMMMQVGETVSGALKAVEKAHTVYVPGLQYKFLVWLTGILPRAWAERIVRRSGKNYRDSQ
ncbi:MAG: SDR family oxidoreductase [Aquisalinus sp.]|nr:SDR family oxidoreductase [Aquisalinus sp.]